MKKAFTLFELIIAVILISLLYYFSIDKFSKHTFETNSKITLTNLKKTLLKYPFSNSISIKCIEDDLSCFLFIDGVLQKEKIKNIFHTKPVVYSYSKELSKIEFTPLYLNELDSYDIIFEYSCKKDDRCSEYIVELDDKVYIFNDIYIKPIKFDYLGQVDEYFTKLEEEVKDAF